MLNVTGTILGDIVKRGDVKMHVPYADGMKTDNGVNPEEKERRELRYINHRFPVQC